MADQLASIVESGEPQRLATGFIFTEGPLWHPDGYWLFVDIRTKIIHRLAPGGQPEAFRENSGSSNGLTFDHSGNLIVCEMDNRQVTRRSGDGTYTAIATHADGKRLNRPNDVVGRSDGTIYFTDPNPFMTAEEKELGYAGVHRIAPDGTNSMATKDTEFPNGLAFSPDERTLYVSITRRDDRCAQEKERGEVCEHQFIRAFDVAPDGSLSNNRVFAHHVLRRGRRSRRHEGGHSGPGLLHRRCRVLGVRCLRSSSGDDQAAGGTRQLRLGRSRQPDHVLHRPHVSVHFANDDPRHCHCQELAGN